MGGVHGGGAWRGGPVGEAWQVGSGGLGLAGARPGAGPHSRQGQGLEGKVGMGAGWCSVDHGAFRLAVGRLHPVCPVPVLDPRNTARAQLLQPQLKPPVRPCSALVTWTLGQRRWGRGSPSLLVVPASVPFPPLPLALPPE